MKNCEQRIAKSNEILVLSASFSTKEIAWQKAEKISIQTDGEKSCVTNGFAELMQAHGFRSIE